MTDYHHTCAHPKPPKRETQAQRTKRERAEWKTWGDEKRDRIGTACEFCEGRESGHRHHIVPKQAGGKRSAHHRDNLALVCSFCHDCLHGKNKGFTDYLKPAG